MIDYWISRDYFGRRILVKFGDSDYENLNAFVNMARESCLREALAALEKKPEASYSMIPGEYLQLTAENGIIEAKIGISGGATPVRMPVEDFCRIVTDYLEALDAMFRKLGWR